MDLIEAMEEMERSAPSPPPAYRRPVSAAGKGPRSASAAPASARTVAAFSASGSASWDFVLQQAAFVQTRLKALWAAKHLGSQSGTASNGNTTMHVPFSWVLSKLMRLIEEYPDGVTEAIVVTELMVLLQRKSYVTSSAATDGGGSSRKVVRDVEDMTRVLSELEEQDNAILSQLERYDGHKLSIQAGKGSDIKLEMYLHQRFRACSAFLSSQPPFQSNSVETFPFQCGRTVVFTNAKLMERRDVGATAPSTESSSSPYYLLPMQHLALHLDVSGNALDQAFVKQSIGLARLDQFVAMQDPAILQQLVVKVKVLDIGAVRPSQTPLHIHRQVIFLGDIENQSVPSSSSSIASTQRLAQASHVMILWDEQVALSRLFQVGDELSIFQPYIHVCDAQDTEILRIFSEYSSQQRCMFYLEYGSATVFFVTPQKAAADTTGDSSNTNEASARDSELQKFVESEQPPLRYEVIKHEWFNFSLYGHVRSIRVSHGIPLMAAYFYSYYDPKTNGNYQDTRGSFGPAPTLDRAIVSRFYLVVLLQIYNAVSKQTLTVEVTGENALKALRLRPGQTVLLDGLIAVDVQSPAIRKAREHGAHPTFTPQAAEATLAFQSAEYTTNRLLNSQSASPFIVVLCSDWERIFGKQSMFSENSRLTLVNSTPGLLKTSLGQEPKLMASYVATMTSSNTNNTKPGAFSQMGMILAQMCITYVGWLIPEDENPTQLPYSSDESCRKGYSTMCAHKACLRRLELAPTPNSQTHEKNGGGSSGDSTYVPRWKCNFCQEIFSGMEETSQTFCALVVCLDDGSMTAMSQPMYAICHGETVESLLGVPAQDFSQLSLQDKFCILQQTIGKDYQVLLSRCEQLRVGIPTPRQQFAPTNHRYASGAAAASPSPRKRESSASAVATKVDLRIDLIEPLDAFASSHQLLQMLTREK